MRCPPEPPEIETTRSLQSGLKSTCTGSSARLPARTPATAVTAEGVQNAERLGEDAGQENLAASGPWPSIRALKSRLSARISAGSATVDRRPARGRRRPLPVSRSVSQRKTAKGRRHYSAALSNQANGQLGSPRRDGLYFPLGSILPPFDAHCRRDATTSSAACHRAPDPRGGAARPAALRV